jgi:hypothetical protein
MCFSAEVSFTASAVLMGVGVLNFTQVRSKRTLLLASFPILFALQQLVEGLVWLNATHWLNQSFDIFLSYYFLIMAYCIWPILSPLASFFIEDKPSKKKLMLIFLGIGIVLSIFLLFILFSAQVSTQIIGRSINYDLISPQLTSLSIYLLGLLYMLPVGLAWMFSSHNMLKWAGVLLWVSAMITWRIETACYTSVWCFFGALISILTYFCLRQIARQKLLS